MKWCIIQADYLFLQKYPILLLIPHVPDRIQITLVRKFFQKRQQNTLEDCELFSFSWRVKKSLVLGNQCFHKTSALVGTTERYDK